MSLVLASGSDRRLRLLRAGGAEPTVVPADIDEAPRRGESPPDLVRRLARGKATAVADTGAGEVVLAADTEVALDGRVLGKPVDPEDATRMLRAQSGRTLTVWSGVAVATARGLRTRTVRTLLRFATLDDAAISAYVATGEPFGVAGGFRIQGRGAALVAGRTGCWTNVVGLPMCRTAVLLRAAGIPVRPDRCPTG